MPKKIHRRALANGTIKTYDYSTAAKDQRTDPRTVGAVIAEYRLSPDYANKRPETLKIYARMLDIIGTSFHAIPIADIKRRHILGMRDAYQNKPGIAFNLVKMWSILLKFALEREYIVANPAFSIKTLPLGSHRRWSDKAIAHAQKFFPEPMRRAVLLALYTGQREGDCIRMSWADIDGSAIRVVQEKTGAKLWIPCHCELMAELETWKAGRTATTLLTRPTGIAWSSAKAFAIAFSRLVHQHEELKGLVFHGLRKSAAARLAEAGCTVHEIAAITGHARLSMVEVYTKEADQKLRASAAIAKLEAYRRK